MPKIQKVYSLEITPEQFLHSCDEAELLEVSFLLDKELAKRKKHLHNINVTAEVVAPYKS